MTPATVGVVPKGEGGGLMFCSLWTWRGLPVVIPLHLTRAGWMSLGMQLVGEPQRRCPPVAQSELVGSRR